MATRAKDTTPGIVKEKRRITHSPSFPRPANTTKKSVNTATTTTIAPNHIKPTKPSNVDPSIKPVSTKASTGTLQKPDLARRKSFGSRPLSQPKSPDPAANAEKSPKTTGTGVRPKPVTQRSRSSSSLKTPASPSARPKVAATVTRNPVPGKSARPATRPATTAVYRKKEPQSNAATKTLKSPTSKANRDSPQKSESIDEIDATKPDHEVETESCQDIHDQESVCSSVVDAHNENDDTLLNVDLEHDDQLDQINEEAYLLSEASTVVSEIEQSEVELENKVNEVTEKLQQESTNNDEPKIDADNGNDASSPKDGLQESEEVNMSTNETNEKDPVAAPEEEKEAVDDKNEKSGDEKEKAVEQVRPEGIEQVKVDKEDTTKKINNNNTTGGSDKKESPVSNEVIEETASKLRVKRKNKVLALVGAFETVMSKD